MVGFVATSQSEKNKFSTIVFVFFSNYMQMSPVTFFYVERACSDFEKTRSLPHRGSVLTTLWCIFVCTESDK